MRECTETGNAARTTGIAWGDAISAERASKLEALVRRGEESGNHHRRAGPFAQVRLSGADGFWLATRARNEGSVATAAPTQPADDLTPAVDHAPPPARGPLDEAD